MADVSNPLLKDILEFLRGMARHWTWWIGSTVIASLLAVIQGSGTAIPTWALWTWALAGIIIAAFLSWREQYHRAELRVIKRKQAVDECLERCIALLTGDKPILPFTALSRADAHKLQTPVEVYGVCMRLFGYGYGNPFAEIDTIIPMEDWLKFLRYFKYGAKVNREDPVGYLDAAQEWAHRRYL